MVTAAEREKRERRALFNELKLSLTEHIDEQLDKYAKRSDENLEAHLNLEIKPLILEAIRESSEIASEISVVKYCRTINLDYNNMESMNEHALDLAHARKGRKREENFTGTAISTLAKLTVITVIAAFLSKYFPHLGE